MNIAIAINEAYIPYAYVMLTSLFENHPDTHIRVFILYGSIPDESLAIFEHLENTYNQEIIAIQVPLERLPDTLPHTNEWTIEVYFRLMMQDLLPEDCDRVLYLDTDIIICNSLLDYYNIDFGGNVLAVNKDMSAEECGLLPQQEKLYASHIANGDFVYFNAGIMLMNLDILRKEYSLDYFIEEFLKRQDLIFAQEQDLLNDLFYGKVLFVDENRYDLFAKIAYNKGATYESVQQTTSIIHYAGRKPWTPDASRYDIERVWWDYAKLTPFYLDLMEATFYGEMKCGFCDSTIIRLCNEKNEIWELLQKLQKLLPGL